MKKLLLIPLLLLVPCFTVYGQTQTITLSTYYPAPFGNYDRLRLIPRDTEPGCSAAVVGAMFYSKDSEGVRVCQDTLTWEPLTFWDKSNDDIFIKSPDSTTNYFVGIGDDSPDAVLEISGGNLSDDLLMISKDVGDDGDIFIVKNDGKVGIGEADPTSQLVVHGEGVTGATSGLLVVDDSGNDILFVRDDGKVKIGRTATMDNVLEVNGGIDIEVSGQDSQIRFQEAGSGWYTMGIDRSDGGAFKINFGGSLGAANHFRMTSSGDVTIGGSLSVNDGTNSGTVQVQWVPDATRPGFYATYAP